jgi:hypothetical protein
MRNRMLNPVIKIVNVILICPDFYTKVNVSIVFLGWGETDFTWYVGYY